MKNMAGKTRMRKQSSVRKHEVKADLSNFELVKARSSLRLRIYANTEKIGELEIGRGSLYWYGSGRHCSKRIGCPRFAHMMNSLAYPERSAASPAGLDAMTLASPVFPAAPKPVGRKVRRTARKRR